MKTVGWVLVALLAGMVLGSWSLKGDLRKAQAQIRDLQQELARSGRKASRVDGIVTMLNIPDSARHHADAAPGTHPPRNVSRTGPTAPPLPGTRRRPRADATGDAPPSMEAQIERAKELWKVRSDLARNTFLTTVPESTEQRTQFDVVMAAMNMRLSNSIRTWVDVIKAENALTPENGIKMMNDLSESVVQVYTDLDRSMPVDWRDKTGGEFQPIDFVNPEVAAPLTEVENVMRTSPWDRTSGSTNSRPHSTTPP